MSSPITRDLYHYAKEKWPQVAEHLAWLDREIADHNSAILSLLRTRLEVLRNLSEGRGLESIVQPHPPQPVEELIGKFR